MIVNPFANLYYEVAEEHGLDVRLVEAMGFVESSHDTWAWNPEPRYGYLWDCKRGKPFRVLTPSEAASEAAPPGFPGGDQEWQAQQASWGLLQVMGAVARERGFPHYYLTRLCDPRVGLTMGCLHLLYCLRWSKGDVPSALAAYNGGFVERNRPGVEIKQNQDYVNKVLGALHG